jgi:hypothetical protein
MHNWWFSGYSAPAAPIGTQRQSQRSSLRHDASATCSAACYHNCHDDVLLQPSIVTVLMMQAAFVLA